MSLRPLDRRQLRALDATANTIGLSTEVLMERAGFELARFITQHAKKHHHVLFVCGTGNNAGDGLAACRHLHNKGFITSILLANKQALVGHVQKNLAILDRLSLPINEFSRSFSLTPYDLVIDCLLGYSQTQAPQEPIASIITAMNKSNKAVIACDVPSGMNTDDGTLYHPHIQAKATISFAAPKLCFTNPQAQKACGDIIIAGIGIPSLVYEQLGLQEGEYLVEGVVTFK